MVIQFDCITVTVIIVFLCRLLLLIFLLLLKIGRSWWQKEFDAGFIESFVIFCAARCLSVRWHPCLAQVDEHRCRSAAFAEGLPGSAAGRTTAEARQCQG